MSYLKRREQRKLRHIHAPHGPGSSRAVIHEASDAFRDTLYRGFDQKGQKKIRIDFSLFISKNYNIPESTIRAKLLYWMVEEWEVFGLMSIVQRYCELQEIPSPDCTNVTDVPSAVAAVAAWHSSIRRRKMHFYNFLRERGMCRDFFSRIINGTSTLNSLQVLGLNTAFSQFSRTKMAEQGIEMVD